MPIDPTATVRTGCHVKLHCRHGSSKHEKAEPRLSKSECSVRIRIRDLPSISMTRHHHVSDMFLISAPCVFRCLRRQDQRLIRLAQAHTGRNICRLFTRYVPRGSIRFVYEWPDGVCGTGNERTKRHGIKKKYLEEKSRPIGTEEDERMNGRPGVRARARFALCHWAASVLMSRDRCVICGYS